METKEKSTEIFNELQAFSKKVDEFETKHIYYTPTLEDDYKELIKELEKLKEKCDEKQVYFITKRIEIVINKFRKPILPICYITDALQYEGKRKLFYNPIYNRFFINISHRYPSYDGLFDNSFETTFSIQKLKEFFGVDNDKYILDVVIPEIYYTVNFREDSNHYITVRLYGRKSSMMVQFKTICRWDIKDPSYQPEPLLYRESNFELYKLLQSKYNPELNDSFSISIKEIRDLFTPILYREGTYDFYPNFNTDTKDVMKLLKNKMYYINLARRDFEEEFGDLEFELKDDETILFKDTYNSRLSRRDRVERVTRRISNKRPSKETVQTKTFTVEDYCNEIGMEHILKYWDEKYNGNKKPNEVEYLNRNKYFFRCPKCGSLNGIDLDDFNHHCKNNFCHNYRKDEVKTIAYNLSKHFDIKTNYQPKWNDISPFNIYIENINYKHGDKIYKNIAVEHKYIVSNDAVTKLEIKQCQENDTFIFFIATKFGYEIPSGENTKIFYCNELFDDSEEGMRRAISKLLAELGIPDAEINVNLYSSIIQDFAISNEPQKEIDQENNTEKDIDFGDIETMDDFVEFDTSALDEIPAPPSAVDCGE